MIGRGSNDGGWREEGIVVREEVIVVSDVHYTGMEC